MANLPENVRLPDVSDQIASEDPKERKKGWKKYHKEVVKILKEIYEVVNQNA